MIRSSLTICLALFFLSALSIMADDMKKQQSELQKIQSEVNESKKRLDSLKAIELNRQKQIGDIDQKITSNRKVIQRLNKELDQLRSEITKSEGTLANRQDELSNSRRRYLGSIRQFYIATRRPTEDGLDRPNVELELNRKIRYLSALAGFESGSITESEALLAEAMGHMDDLSGQQKEISKMKKSKESSTSLERSKKKKNEKDLELIRRKKAAEADRILTLEQASREIESIIAKLEQDRRRKTTGKASLGPSVFATQKGQLRSPFRGKIIMPFGSHVDKTTNLKSFSPGITIKGKTGQTVSAVASGEIAHVGQLRGYGNFVIINHDDQYYTTYAGLGRTEVVSGQFVGTGSRLAVAGEDGTVRFEIRFGREPVDPVEWIKIDSF